MEVCFSFAVSPYFRHPSIFVWRNSSRMMITLSTKSYTRYYVQLMQKQTILCSQIYAFKTQKSIHSSRTLAATNCSCNLFLLRNLSLCKCPGDYSIPRLAITKSQLSL